MPGGQQLSGLDVGNAGGIFRQVAFLGRHIQPGKQGQSFVGRQRHHMTVALN